MIKHPSYIEIDSQALAHNLSYLRNIIGPNVQLSSVVKGNAYGHGVEVMVPLLEHHGVDHFSVFSAYEAYEVKNLARKDTKIMIMGAIENDQIAWCIETGVEMYVFDMDRLHAIVQTAQKINKPATIHIELETGMNRTGFNAKSLPTVVDVINEHRAWLHISGICTHYAGAESITNYYRIEKQKSRFKKLSKKLATKGIVPDYYHTACSAATLRYASTRMDLVRIGILQYGFFPSQEVMIDLLSKKKIHDYPLKRIISWKSHVMDIKYVKAGEFIGYGTSFLANHDMKIALIPTGYSHGFNRSLSNKGRVLIRGQRLGVVGTINMNMMSVDATNVDDLQKGDEVVLIGKQEDQEISVSSFSETSSLLNYEMLTRLPSRIPRTIINQ